MKTRKAAKTETKAKPIAFRETLGLWAPYVMILAWAFSLYFPALANPFVYDDQFQIVRNPNIQSFEAASLYFREPVEFDQAFGTNAGVLYRPLFWMSLVADREIWGLNPEGFHATNIILHALNGILIFLLLQRLMPAPLPLLVSLAWLSLPIHTEVVAWVCGRGISLATLFSLLAVLAALNYVERRSAKQLLFLVLASSAALLSHEAGVVAPLLALLAAAIKSPAPERRRALLPVLIACGVPLAVYTVLRIAFLRAGAPSLQALPSILLLGPISMAKYVWWTIHAPAMSVERSTELAGSAFRSRTYALAWLTIAGIGGVCIWLRRSVPALTFGFAAAAIALLPFAQILRLYQSMAERYVYTAAIGMVLGIVALLVASQKKLKVPQWTVIATVCLWIVASVIPLRARIRPWSSERFLYTTSLRANPRSAILYQNLGVLEQEAGKLDSAADLYLLAIKLEPNFLQAHRNLANLYFRTGKLTPAAEEFKKVLEYAPENLEAQLNLGSILLVQGDSASAIAILNRLVQQHPESYEAQVDLGLAFYSRKDDSAARTHLETALRLKPDSPEAAYNLGVVEEGSGNVEAARRLYQQALQYRPGYTKAAQHLQSLQSSPPHF